MKKIFKNTKWAFVALLILPLLAFTVADGSKSCKVAGTNGTVLVQAYAKGTTIHVDFNNDTDVDVNIKFTVNFSGKKENGRWDTTQQISRTKRVSPHSSSSMDLPTSFVELNNVRVASLSGDKCSN